MRCLVVGAGPAGCTAARMLADMGHRVYVKDRFDEPGGMCHDSQGEYGYLQTFGPHIFHTNDEKVWNFLNRFAEFNHYRHRVLSLHNGAYYPMPVNLTTLNLFAVEPPGESSRKAQNSYEVCLNRFGPEITEALFVGYTKKQWGRHPSKLDPEVCARIPLRNDHNSDFFADKFQGQPIGGFTKMFDGMLNHHNISFHGDEWKGYASKDHVFYSGPLDAYYGHCYGKLPYRCSTFRFGRLVECNPAPVVNYPDDDEPRIRSTDFSQLDPGLKRNGGYICHEYTSDEGTPSYPVPCPEARAVREKYMAAAAREKHVTFIGRLGTYRYMNIDATIADTMERVKEFLA